MRIDLLHYFNDDDCDSLMQIKKSALKFCIILLYHSTHYLLNTLKLSCMNTERKFEVKLINQTSSLPVKFDSNFTDNWSDDIHTPSLPLPSLSGCVTSSDFLPHIVFMYYVAFRHDCYAIEHVVSNTFKHGVIWTTPPLVYEYRHFSYRWNWNQTSQVSCSFDLLNNTYRVIALGIIMVKSGHRLQVAPEHNRLIKETTIFFSIWHNL